MKSGKWIVGTILSFFLIMPSILLAADETVIQDIQSDVTATKGKADQNAADINSLKGGLPELQRQINNLQTQINNMPAGPQGPAGLQGETGPAGADGADGLSCWDLNGNRACDALEDKNGDSVCDALDCQGPTGPPGAATPDRTADLCALYEAMLPLGGPTPPEYCTEPVDACGDGHIDIGEECDDGNTIAGDGCSQCMLSVCGNGRIDPLEQCDDSNTIDGDGCTSVCLVEASDTDPEPFPLVGITRAHNGIRDYVNSPPLVWDSAIALEAQAWADYLASIQTMQHNPDFADFSVAENIAFTTSAPHAVDMWASEIVNTIDGGGCLDYMLCGHYANIINPLITKIGCGVNSNYWVCNYSY